MATVFTIGVGKVLDNSSNGVSLNLTSPDHNNVV